MDMVGWPVGREVLKNEGTTVGATVGTPDGLNVGLIEDGKAVGLVDDFVGASVGMPDGLAVNPIEDGTAVGLAEGPIEGRIEGRNDGVGNVVGSKVGYADGSWLGL